MKGIISTRRAAAVWKVSAVVAASIALSACGNGGGDDNGNGGGGGGGGDTLGTVDLSNPQAVQAQVGTLGQLLSSVSALDAGAAVPSAARSGIAKASEACPDGGSIDDVAPASRNVNSPFTSQAITVAGARAVNCTYKFVESQGGQTLDYSMVINGLTEAGNAEDAGSVLYVQVGESETSPYRYAFDAKVSGNAGGQNFSSETLLDFGVFYRLDSKADNAGSDNRIVMRLDGDYTARASSGGQSGSSDGDFTSFVGKSGEPFTVVTASQGVTLNGRYGFGISPAPAGTTCTSAEVAVETTEALAPATSGSGSPYDAGALTLRSGSSSASVRFNNDGTVTVTPQGGAATTVSYAEALAAAAPCVGFAFAGLAFAGGL